MEGCRSDIPLRCGIEDTGSWWEPYWGRLLPGPRQRLYAFLSPDLRAMELVESVVLQLGLDLSNDKWRNRFLLLSSRRLYSKYWRWIFLRPFVKNYNQHLADTLPMNAGEQLFAISAMFKVCLGRAFVLAD